MYVKACIVNVNKPLKPFFLEQHINIVNSHASKLLVYLYPIELLKQIFSLQHKSSIFIYTILHVFENEPCIYHWMYFVHSVLHENADYTGL